jgi:hypothetical protein
MFLEHHKKLSSLPEYFGQAEPDDVHILIRIYELFDRGCVVYSSLAKILSVKEK